MSKGNRNEYTPQEILNWGLDDEQVKPPTSLRGQLNYADGGGWLRVPAGGIYPLVQMDRTSGNLDYYAFHSNRSAADSDTSWVIYKFTRDANGEIIKIQSKIGTWTGRATGF